MGSSQPYDVESELLTWLKQQSDSLKSELVIITLFEILKHVNWEH